MKYNILSQNRRNKRKIRKNYKRRLKIYKHMLKRMRKCQKTCPKFCGFCLILRSLTDKYGEQIIVNMDMELPELYSVKPSREQISNNHGWWFYPSRSSDGLRLHILQDCIDIVKCKIKSL